MELSFVAYGGSAAALDGKDVEAPATDSELGNLGEDPERTAGVDVKVLAKAIRLRRPSFVLVPLRLRPPFARIALLGRKASLMEVRRDVLSSLCIRDMRDARPSTEEKIMFSGVAPSAVTATSLLDIKSILGAFCAELADWGAPRLGKKWSACLFRIRCGPTSLTNYEKQKHSV